MDQVVAVQGAQFSRGGIDHFLFEETGFAGVFLVMDGAADHRIEQGAACSFADFGQRVGQRAHRPL